MIGDVFLRTRRMQAHVDADAAAGVMDPEAFVLTFRRSWKPGSTYELQRHRHTTTKIAQRDELHDDIRAADRVRSSTRTAVLRWGALIGFFASAEVFTLSHVLLALGVPPAEAYVNALMLAGLAVGLIEAATRAKRTAVQVLIYAGLVSTVLCLAWVRSQSFFEGGGDGIARVVSGVIATAVAIGSGYGLHYYRSKARAAARERLASAGLQRDERTLDKKIAVAEKAVIKSEVAAERAAAEDAQLRRTYTRLHAIALARRRANEDPDTAPA